MYCFSCFGRGTTDDDNADTADPAEPVPGNDTTATLADAALGAMEDIKANAISAQEDTSTLPNPPLWVPPKGRPKSPPPAKNPAKAAAAHLKPSAVKNAVRSAATNVKDKVSNKPTAPENSSQSTTPQVSNQQPTAQDEFEDAGEEFASCAASFTSQASAQQFFDIPSELAPTGSLVPPSTLPAAHASTIPATIASTARTGLTALISPAAVTTEARPTHTEPVNNWVPRTENTSRDAAAGAAAAAHANQGGGVAGGIVAGGGAEAVPTGTWDDGGPHVELLKTACKMYSKHSHPCGACHAILDHCRDSKIHADELQRLATTGPETIEGVAQADLMRLLRAAVNMELAQRKIVDDSDWEVVRDDALKMMYQAVPNSTEHAFRGRCTLEAPMENLVAITREFDLSKHWNRYLVDTVTLREYSIAELLGVAVVWLPWPLPNMNIVVEAVGTDLLDTVGGFLVTFHTPRDVDMALIHSVPAARSSNPLLPLMPGSCVFFEPQPPLEPGGPYRIRATMEARVDPKLKHVPHILITFVLRVMGPFIYSMVVKLLHKEFIDPTRPIPARMPTRPLLYKMVKEHTQEYLADLAAKSAGTKSARYNPEMTGQPAGLARNETM